MFNKLNLNDIRQVSGGTKKGTEKPRKEGSLDAQLKRLGDFCNNAERSRDDARYKCSIEKDKNEALKTKLSYMQDLEQARQKNGAFKNAMISIKEFLGL